MSRAARLVLVAVALLAGAWLFAAPPGGPPLYDGLGFPDQPYRFLSPPAGYRATPAPTAATVDARVGPGVDATLDAVSAELGPQVEVFLSEGSIVSPARATVAHVRAAPVQPARVPADGTVWGNAYHLGAESDAGPCRIRPGGDLNSIRLRAPTGPPPAGLIEYDDGSGWRRLKTTRIGGEIYAAPVAGAGDYALVAPPGQARVSGAPAPTSAAVSGSGAVVPGDTAGTGASTSRTGPLLAIVGAGIVLLGAIAVLIRLRRRLDDPGPRR